MKKSTEPEYRVRYPDNNHLEYEDDQVTLTFWTQLSAPPRPGIQVGLGDLPRDLHLSRSELARRIRAKVEKWRFKVIFLDSTGHEIEAPPGVHPYAGRIEF